MRLPAYTCIASLFFLVGLGGGSWAAHLAGLPEALDISHQMLGFVHLAAVGGALLAFSCSGWILRQWRQSTTTTLSMGTYCLVVPLAGATLGVWTTLLALIVMGFCSGFLVIAMNLYAIRWEKAHDVTILAKCHAFLSLGTLFGAITGQQVDAREFGVVEHLAVVMFCIALFFTVALMRQLRLLDNTTIRPTDENRATKAKQIAPPKSQSLVLVGVMVAGAAICENSINTWGPLFIYQQYELSTARATSAFVVATLVTALVRLGVDGAAKRFGPNLLITSGCGLIILAAATLFWARSAGTVLVSIAMTSVGVASIIPLGYREASHRRPEKTEKALAVITQWTYAGALIAPPVIGCISDHISLRVALTSLGMLSGAIFWSKKALDRSPVRS